MEYSSLRIKIAVTQDFRCEEVERRTFRLLRDCSIVE